MPLIVIVGPCGAGKTTLADILVDLGMPRAVSTTTRAPRPGEVDGEHYNFVTPEVMDQIIDSGCMLEHATYDGNTYGLDLIEVQRVMGDTGNAVAVTEIVGYRAIAEKMQEAGAPLIGIFLDADQAVLKDRLNKRGDMTPERLAARISMIERDKEGVAWFAPGSFGPTVKTHILNGLDMDAIKAFAAGLTRELVPAAKPEIACAAGAVPATPTAGPSA